MTALTNAEGRALLAGLTGKGKAKPDKPPPIKLTTTPEKAPKKPATATQLDQTCLDRVLTEIVLKAPEMLYVAHCPGRKEITYKGHELVLVPREAVKPEYLKRDNS